MKGTRNRWTPGRFAYLCYYKPLGAIKRSWKEGGPISQMITAAGRRRMIRASQLLPVTPISRHPRGEICLLTGRKFWFQTIWCASTFLRHTLHPPRLVIHDDGSLRPRDIAEITRLFPGVHIVPIQEIERRLDVALPSSRFPVLRAHRQEYPLLKKLTDIHAGRTGWRLYLDSDMLTFSPPNELHSWLAHPSQPVHMKDIHNAYGYDLSILTALAGTPVPERINTGILGLRSTDIPWELLEEHCRFLLETHGSSYYLEQALTALLLAGKPCYSLSADRYLLMPDDAECLTPSAVLHHYVDLSKRGYYRSAWKLALARIV